MKVIQTDRLRLRQWSEKDKKPFSRMCADPHVMRYFPSTMSEIESNKLIEKIARTVDEQGFGFWAAELRESDEFIGFIGLSPIADGYEFAPTVEIGWRLMRVAWGNGYASEGAKAALRFGFETLKLPEIMSMTAVINKPSENVMKKLGMHRQQDTFMHPSLPIDSELREHLLYRLTRNQFMAECSSHKVLSG